MRACNLGRDRVHFTPAPHNTTLPPQPATPLKGLRGRACRILAVLHRWAESGWAGPATAGWTFAQGSAVPGPSDALLVPFGLADPPRVYRLAVWALVGSTLGGILAYAAGAFAFQEVVAPMLGFFGIDPGELVTIRAWLTRYGWLVVFGSSITPFPVKLVAVSSGAFGVPFPIFALALSTGRAVRFFTIAVLIHLAGERIARWWRRVTLGC
jgi:membrane protein YqaA with SNARE-associated domain